MSKGELLLAEKVLRSQVLDYIWLDVDESVSNVVKVTNPSRAIVCTFITSYHCM